RQRRRPRREDAAASGPPHLAVERRILAEDGALELLQRAARLDAELVDQHAAALAVDGQRVDLPAAAIEGEHQVAAQPLAQRLVAYECRQLTHQLLVAAELELGRDAPFERVEPQIGQATGGREGERLACELGERLTAPQAERLAQQLSPARG